MNSTIFVQPSIGIPAGPLTRRTVAESSVKKTRRVAAVIRPTPRQPGVEPGSLRLDPGHQPSPPQSHVRNYDLDDYVNWLRAKIEADKLDERPTAVAMEAESLVNRKQSIEPTNNQFSTVTDTELVQVVENRPIEATPKGVRFEEFSALGYSGFTERLDPPHQGIGRSITPSTESTEPEPIVETEPELAEEVVKISAYDSDQFISAVSQAIASVLTDKPEPDFKNKVRTHFESELHAHAISALLNARKVDEEKSLEEEQIALLNEKTRPVSADEEVEEEPPAAEIADEAPTAAIATPPVTMPTEAEEIASQIITNSSREIPTGVAAWDVEDFRWPVVTNQMIVSGGSAIDQLAQSSFGMLAPDYQRMAITSLGRGEGASTIAISLARWVAALGKNVLLVDADFARPSLSEQIGLAPNLSWVNAVNQSLPAAEVIVRSQKSNLCVMPLAPVVSRATWPRFIYDKLGELIDQVRSHFDLILVDAGPSQQLLAELSRPQHLCDASMMVHNGVESAEFHRAKLMLEGFGLDKIIVAKNRAHQKTVNVA